MKSIFPTVGRLISCRLFCSQLINQRMVKPVGNECGQVMVSNFLLALDFVSELKYLFIVNCTPNLKKTERCLFDIGKRKWND